MKILHLFFLLITTSFKSSGQDSHWEMKSVNGILNFSLPLNSQYTKSQFIKNYTGQLNSDYYTLQYYDTVYLPIENERQFEISLQGFVSGRSSGPALKGYSALIVDTLIGNTNGLFAIYKTKDTAKYYKEQRYYVTIVNNHYYCFFLYSPYVFNENTRADFFFRSIRFEADKIKERNYRLPKIYLKKDKL